MASTHPTIPTKMKATGEYSSSEPRVLDSPCLSQLSTPFLGSHTGSWNLTARHPSAWQDQISLWLEKQIPPRSITSPISQAPSTPHHPGTCPARAKAKPPTRWFGRSFVKRTIGFLTKVKWSLEPVNWGFGMVNGQMGYGNGKTVSRNLGMVDFAF